jgi:hypothetical protein
MGLTSPRAGTTRVRFVWDVPGRYHKYDATVGAVAG